MRRSRTFFALLVVCSVVVAVLAALYYRPIASVFLYDSNFETFQSLSEQQELRF